jgi:hypothetical protein
LSNSKKKLVKNRKAGRADGRFCPLGGWDFDLPLVKSVFCTHFCTHGFSGYVPDMTAPQAFPTVMSMPRCFWLVFGPMLLSFFGQIMLSFFGQIMLSFFGQIMLSFFG